jgi:hypothetical protein
MTGHIRLAIVTLTLVLTAATAGAQEQVTVVRRNGERIAGRFEAWNRQTDTVYIRVSASDQRTFPMRDVLVIEVGGNATNLPGNETDAARGADNVLVTRGGEVLRGRLISIDGGQGSENESIARVIVFQSGGERRVPMSQTARLYLGNYPQQTTAVPAPAPLPQTPATPGSLRVPANQQWTPTNVTVRRGDRVQFSAQGEIQLSDDPGDRAVAAGSVRGRKAPNSQAPNLPAGALIGRLGNGAPFAIGDQTQPLTLPGEGPLWLGINDDEFSDNRGDLVVTIRVIRGR